MQILRPLAVADQAEDDCEASVVSAVGLRSKHGTAGAFEIQVGTK